MSDQLSFDLGDVVGEPAGGPSPARPRRRMRPWEVERAKLKSWQRERRRADQRQPWLVADAWPNYDASFADLRSLLRVEREARRCGC